MKNKPLFKHDLIKLLRSFTAKEQKRFLMFLNSEFFVTRKALVILYTELIKFHPLYTNVSCSKESLYSIVYPGMNYNGGTMRDLLSSLYEAAAEFIAIDSMIKNNNTLSQKIYELSQRGLHKNAAKLIREFSAIKGNSGFIDSSYFLERYKLQVMNINLKMIFSNRTSKKSITRLTEDFRSAEEFLLLYSFMEITANFSNLIIFEDRFIDSPADGDFIKAVNEICDSSLYKLVKSKSQYSFVAELYIAMIQAFQKAGNFKYYEKYRNLVKASLPHLSNDEISMHYSKLISCCILGAKYSKHPDNYNSELLKLYLIFLENGYYRDNKTRYIPVNLFRTVVLQAVKLKKLQWLLRVINRFVDELLPSERENMKQYAMAFYYFSTGRSGKALETISSIDITQFIFKYDIYNLKLRIFYEDNELNSALELIHAYTQFLRNDKMMPAPRKAFHRAFLKYIKRLISITEGSKKFEAGLEIQKLQNESCAYKDWLTEKLSLFESSKKNYSMAG